MMAGRVALVALLARGGAGQEGPTKEEWEADQADAAANASAATAREAKLAAVNKVSSMLEKLQTQVLEEGEKEVATYNKFACFCKDTTADKVSAITTGKDSKTSLETAIAALSGERDALDTLVATTTGEIEHAEGEMKSAEFSRSEEAKVYTTNAADLSGAMKALDSAIAHLKASKTAAPSLIEMQAIGTTVRDAALLADALSIGGVEVRRAAAFLQQAPDVPMEDYKFHSNDIIATLEQLQKDFRSEKNDIDAAEVSAVAAHDSFMQEKTDYVKQKNHVLAQAQADKQAKQEAIAEKSEELSTVAATLLDDQQYLDELSQMCSDKAKTWDQRSQVRQDELSMLTTVIGIIRGEVTDKTSAATIRFAQKSIGVHQARSIARDASAMDAIEAAAEDADDAAAPSFLQEPRSGAKASFLAKRHGSPTDGRREVADMLRGVGDKLRSTLLTSLASQISSSADPFVKIKKLIQELIERLLQEAGNESNQKSWCDKATKDAEQKRDYSAEDIARLNGEMGELEALRDKLSEEITVLTTEIDDLHANRNQTQTQRDEESAENAATVTEANAGLSAVSMAIDIMSKWYLTAAKGAVNLTLVQGPADDAPNAGFGNGDAYQGAQSESTGIIGMLEVMQGDFERTISETEYAEKEAEQNHLQFMTESGMSLAAKKKARGEDVRYRDNAIENLESASGDLNAKTEVLKTAITELLDLKPVCVDTGMSYEERVARREDEIKALNKALCILTAYQEYGPGGAASAEC